MLQVRPCCGCGLLASGDHAALQRVLGSGMPAECRDTDPYTGP